MCYLHTRPSLLDERGSSFMAFLFRSFPPTRREINQEHPSSGESATISTISCAFSSNVVRGRIVDSIGVVVLVDRKGADDVDAGGRVDGRHRASSGNANRI